MPLTWGPELGVCFPLQRNTEPLIYSLCGDSSGNSHLFCGLPDWAIDFANLHPNVKVLGTDLSPIQPDYVPTNCDFIIDDATQDWSFHQRFDYIHTRTLTMGMPDWDKFVDQAYKHLQPGGILELQVSLIFG